MKNRLIGIVILVLCFCVFLTACDTRKPGKKADESTAPIESSAPTINETENNNQVSNPTTIPAPSQGSDSSEGEVPCLDANSYEEYLKIIKTVQLPEGFVKYSDISQLGDFEYFVFLSHVIIGNNSKYEYDLIDENNITFSFSVEPVEDNQDASPLPLIDDVNTMDMRKLSTNTKGRYIYNGIEYKYFDGKLYYISWEDNGRMFTLGSDSFGDYPVGTNTFAEKLLNANNAEAVIASISVPVEKE